VILPRRACVRWVGPALAATVAMTATVAAVADKSHREALTRRLLSLEKKLATNRAPDSRRQLADEIEWTRHDLGPVDSAGQRIHCRAMWHDAALTDVEGQVQKMERVARLANDPAAEVRLALRRLAREALWKAWAFSDRGPDKFQLDAVGTYVYNNLAALDDLADRAAKHLADAGVTVDLAAAAEAPTPPPPAPNGKPKDKPKDKPKKPRPPKAPIEDLNRGPAPLGYLSDPKPPDTAAAPGGEMPGTGATSSAATPPPTDSREQAVGLIRDGLTRMVRSVALICGADAWGNEARAKRVAALDDFGAALADVHVATVALDAAGPTGPVVLPAEEPAPGLTANDKAVLAETNDLVAGIPPGPWDPVRDHLARFAAIAEQGLKYPSARREASQLLDMTHRAAQFVRGLIASKAALPERVAERRVELIEALGHVAKAAPGQREYGEVNRLCPTATHRHALDASVLTPKACQGLLQLLNVSSVRFDQTNKSKRQYERFRENLKTLIGALRLSARPALSGMDAQLQPLYEQTRQELHRRAEALGTRPPTDGGALAGAVDEAVNLANDLRRLERADAIIAAARALLPCQYEPLYKGLLERIGLFILDPSAAKASQRSAFDQYAAPLDRLTKLRMPDKEHTAVAMRLSNGAYRAAATVFGERLVRSIVSAGQGNTNWIALTLNATPMFNLLRHRAVAEAKGLTCIDTACLEAFSVPPKPWSAFLSALDKRLIANLRQYGGRRGAESDLGDWDRVFTTVAAAQYLTHEAATQGQTDLARLVSCLQRATRPDPPPQRWVTWAYGYHTLEAAVSLVASQNQTARQHLIRVDSIASNCGVKVRLGGQRFDPP